MPSASWRRTDAWSCNGRARLVERQAEPLEKEPVTDHLDHQVFPSFWNLQAVRPAPRRRRTKSQLPEFPLTPFRQLTLGAFGDKTTVEHHHRWETVQR